MSIERQLNGPSVFISYCWVNKCIVDQIEFGFSSHQRKCFVRDVRDAPNYESIKNFMHRIKTSDFVILVISDAYMKSRNCMYEILELLKNDYFKDRIFPIIINDHGLDIYSDKAISSYLSYWAKRYNELAEECREFSPEEKVELYETLRVIGKIRTSIGPFVAALQDLKSPSLAYLESKNFQPIKQKIWPNGKQFPPNLLDKCLVHLSDQHISVALSRHTSEDAGTFGRWLFSCLWPPRYSGEIQLFDDSQFELYKLYLEVIEETENESEIIAQVGEVVVSKYKYLVSNFFEERKGGQHFGYYIMKDPKLEELANNTAKLMTILNKMKYFKHEVLRPDLFLVCSKHLKLESNISLAIENYILLDSLEFGKWLLNSLSESTCYYSRNYRNCEAILCNALVIRQIGSLTAKGQEIRDALIMSIQDTFEYDWEYNDSVKLLKRVLICALLIIGDEISLKALAIRFPNETEWKVKIKKIDNKLNSNTLDIMCLPVLVENMA